MSVIVIHSDYFIWNKYLIIYTVYFFIVKGESMKKFLAVLFMTAVLFLVSAPGRALAGSCAQSPSGLWTTDGTDAGIACVQESDGCIHPPNDSCAQEPVQAVPTPVPAQLQPAPQPANQSSQQVAPAPAGHVQSWSAPAATTPSTGNGRTDDDTLVVGAIIVIVFLALGGGGLLAGLFRSVGWKGTGIAIMVILGVGVIAFASGWAIMAAGWIGVGLMALWLLKLMFGGYKE